VSTIDARTSRKDFECRALYFIVGVGVFVPLHSATSKEAVPHTQQRHRTNHDQQARHGQVFGKNHASPSTADHHGGEQAVTSDCSDCNEMQCREANFQCQAQYRERDNPTAAMMWIDAGARNIIDGILTE
jgi:hypothetical protein